MEERYLQWHYTFWQSKFIKWDRRWLWWQHGTKEGCRIMARSSCSWRLRVTVWWWRCRDRKWGRRWRWKWKWILNRIVCCWTQHRRWWRWGRWWWWWPELFPLCRKWLWKRLHRDPVKLPLRCWWGDWRWDARGRGTRRWCGVAWDRAHVLGSNKLFRSCIVEGACWLHNRGTVGVENTHLHWRDDRLTGLQLLERRWRREGWWRWGA